MGETTKSFHLLTANQNLGLGVLEEKSADVDYHDCDSENSEDEVSDERRTAAEASEKGIMETLLGRKGAANAAHIQEVAND